MWIFSQESRCRVRSDRWDFVWKKKTVLRSANANIISFLPFFYKINEGDLPLMYSCVLWCEFVDVVGFLAVIVWPLSLSSGTGVTQKQPKNDKIDNKNNTTIFFADIFKKFSKKLVESMHQQVCLVHWNFHCTALHKIFQISSTDIIYSLLSL